MRMIMPKPARPDEKTNGPCSTSIMQPASILDSLQPCNFLPVIILCPTATSRQIRRLSRHLHLRVSSIVFKSLLPVVMQPVVQRLLDGKTAFGLEQRE